MRIPPEASYQSVTGMSRFRRAVYRVVASIPSGHVVTYGAVARRAGYAGTARAVGTAMKENRYRDVPCHRVVRADGTIGGYAFGGSKAKTIRLRREGLSIVRGRVICTVNT